LHLLKDKDTDSEILISIRLVDFILDSR